MVIIFDINVDKKNTKASVISNFKKVLISDQIIIFVISISLKNNTVRKTKDWKRIIKNITIENHINFQIINSYLSIGLLNIRKMVFPSISLNKS